MRATARQSAKDRKGLMSQSGRRFRMRGADGLMIQKTAYEFLPPQHELMSRSGKRFRISPDTSSLPEAI